MPTYEQELARTKNYKGNVVVRFLGEFFALRKPDSGLAIKAIYNHLVTSLTLNPTTVDPRRVSTTIANYSLRLLDKDNFLSLLVKDRGEELVGQTIEIWLGRSNVGMDFAEYYKLPDTRIKKISYQDNAYTFSSAEQTDRMNKPVFASNTRLNGPILAATSSFIVKDDISDFPDSGYLKLEKEFLFYGSKDDDTKTFFDVTRGNFTTTPADHDEDAVAYGATQLTLNPIDIILQLLISNGGGGSYDVLPDGLGISPAVIDLDEIEALRDEIFSGDTFTLALYSIDNALKFIEKELLEPCNLRFTYSRNSKLTLALLDRARFVESVDIIDHDTITKFTDWSVDDNKIVNQISVEWDYNEDTGKYANKSDYSDADSIAQYDAKTPVKFQWKGVTAQEFVDDFAAAMLARLSVPTPEISFNTHIDKSLLNICEKTLLRTTKLPNSVGRLNFAEELEIISRGLNWQNGDVAFKLVFTSFTGERSCYIAPSSTFVAVDTQSVASVGAGQGDLWQAGWAVRLWDNVANEYTADPVNEIASVDGDEITFVDPWGTTLVASQHRLKFPDYDDAVAEQRRYCFINFTGEDFSNSEKSYKILP